MSLRITREYLVCQRQISACEQDHGAGTGNGTPTRSQFTNCSWLRRTKISRLRNRYNHTSRDNKHSTHNDRKRWNLLEKQPRDCLRR